MKKVLITGAGSYIGTNVENWLNKYNDKHPESYDVTVLDMMVDKWKDFDFHGFDSVYHVAGIAHRKDAPDQLYEDVNHKLAVEVFKRCVDAGVDQFIFMSSGAVYSQSDKNHPNILVDDETLLTPSTPYGISKKKAEDDMKKLADGKNIKLAIVRPPMVYGSGAKGNYNALSTLAKKTPIFPKIKNARSMIYIDNLCEFIRLLIDNDSEGVFLPQNKDYVNTSRLVWEIAKVNGKNVVLTGAFNWAICMGGKVINTINKVFGTYVYKKIKYFDNKYQVVDFKESIRKAEMKQ